MYIKHSLKSSLKTSQYKVMQLKAETVDQQQNENNLKQFDCFGNFSSKKNAFLHLMGWQTINKKTKTIL